MTPTPNNYSPEVLAKELEHGMEDVRTHGNRPTPAGFAAVCSLLIVLARCEVGRQLREVEDAAAARSDARAWKSRVREWGIRIAVSIVLAACIIVISTARTHFPAIRPYLGGDIPQKGTSHAPQSP